MSGPLDKQERLRAHRLDFARGTVETFYPTLWRPLGNLRLWRLSVRLSWRVARRRA